MLMRLEVLGALRAFPFLQSGGSSVEIKRQEMQKSVTTSPSYRLMYICFVITANLSS